MIPHFQIAVSKFCLFFLILFTVSACHKPEPIVIKSPNSELEFCISQQSDSTITYWVNWKGIELVSPSDLGFIFEDPAYLAAPFRIAKIEETLHDTTWQPVIGEESVYADRYREALIRFSDKNKREFALRVRSYNEGIAFRYEFNSNKSINIKEELTKFSFVQEPVVWSSLRAQSEIKKQKLSELSRPVERPLLAQINDSSFVALGEAGLVDFARMKLIADPFHAKTLKTYLETEIGTPEDKGKLYPISFPAGNFGTSWRYLMVGKNPSEILQNNFFVLNLNEECQIDDYSWIKPGKVIREVTLTTQGGLACIDFAVKHDIQFIEFDAGWYGNEYDDASDASAVSVDPKRSKGPLDLHKVIQYGKEKGIGVILYVNRRAMEKQLDQILPLYKSWGVAGVKYGFVNVGPQQWTQWIHEAVRKAANYGLMVDIHDEYRPTGYSRTYPNLITQEGIRGDEESPSNDMVINTIFTRMIAGAGDQTNCYFAERVSSKMGSHASQMAKAICIYSPWQFVYWYDRPNGSPTKLGGAGGVASTIPEIADLEFYDRLVTVWDKKIVLGGYPGEFSAIARKSKDVWFVGALTGTVAKDFKLELTFLDQGKEYEATIFTDDLNLNTNTNLKIQRLNVTRKSQFEHRIEKQNGITMIIKPQVK